MSPTRKNILQLQPATHIRPLKLEKHHLRWPTKRKLPTPHCVFWHATNLRMFVELSKVNTPPWSQRPTVSRILREEIQSPPSESRDLVPLVEAVAMIDQRPCQLAGRPGVASDRIDHLNNINCFCLGAQWIISRSSSNSKRPFPRSNGFGIEIVRTTRPL